MPKLAIPGKLSYETEVRGAWHMGEDVHKEFLSLKEGQELQLIREPENSHDTNAIIVVTLSGWSVGYVAREIANDLAPRLDEGLQFTTRVLTAPKKKSSKHLLVMIEKI